MSTSTRLYTLAAGAAAALVLSACGSSGGTSTGSSSGTSTGTNTATTAGPTVTVNSTGLGQVLTNSAGLTLYYLTTDSAMSFACTGSCLQNWHPLVAPSSGPQPGSGVTATLATVARGSDKQVTIGGHPVYTYVGDSAKGDTNGQNVMDNGGIWYALKSDGSPVIGSSGGSTQTSPPSSGYSY